MSTPGLSRKYETSIKNLTSIDTLNYFAAVSAMIKISFITLMRCRLQAFQAGAAEARTDLPLHLVNACLAITNSLFLTEPS